MIRINLLPVREAVQKRAGKQFLLLAIIILVAEAGALFYLQSEAEGELGKVTTSNAGIASKVAALKEKTKEIAALEVEKAKLEKQKQVLDGLVEGKSGPVKVLFALSTVLRRIDDPEEKITAQNQGWNPDWDPKTLWIESMVEKNRRVRLSGIARSNEDLAQFLRRLNSSKHFVEVELRVTEVFPIKELKDARFVRFDIDAVVLYGPGDVRKLAEGTLTADDQRKRR